MQIDTDDILAQVGQSIDAFLSDEEKAEKLSIALAALAVGTLYRRRLTKGLVAVGLTKDQAKGARRVLEGGTYIVAAGAVAASRFAHKLADSQGTY